MNKYGLDIVNEFWVINISSYTNGRVWSWIYLIFLEYLEEQNFCYTNFVFCTYRAVYTATYLGNIDLGPVSNVLCPRSLFSIPLKT